VHCPTCQSEVLPGQKFCPECGTRIEAACSSCGAALSPSAKFCPECGTPAQALGRPAGSTATPPAAAAEVPVAERRLVSVLFADLVGFTAASQDRDPEETRELLTRYFELARERIERYGGTIEKFIGDAVMAVWGAPTAHEDDAERAVRAALDLVEAVPNLGTTQRPVQARAGVLTGEAAVTIGAQGQGMVAGDLVNTAARLQAVAEPGSVLVGDSTHLAASAAIAFEAIGAQALKGKASPEPAWKALRVIAGRGGSGRSEGLEAPFVGRDEELGLLKDLFHATTREGRARLISITGQAGIGKSRLAWEFEKYIDGLVETVRWHQGRSPSYGEGVTFWALGEMVRRRADIAEGEGPEATREKVRAMLRTYVPVEEEQREIEPAILALLGLEGAPDLERGELFTAWRTLFERVAATGTAVLVIEDLQWADAGLIDFLESLVTWSRNHPILVITLARPELLETRPGWGGGQRNFTSLHLEPLGAEAMRRLLDGLVPGLPATAARAILERAEGVPLYAVETVRMLVADGSLVRDGDRYALARRLDKLSVPQTLHALIAARLDGLEAADRALLQDAAVLGLSFTTGALEAVTGAPGTDLRARLEDLARREWLRVETDARSPERGQYQFVQSVIREVAYSTLAKRDRRQRHLAAARHFEGLEDAELASVLANHYLSAHRSAAEGPEADALAAQARIALRAAAERAASLASPIQALAFLREALTVTSDPAERAALLERAADTAVVGGRYDEALGLLETAVAWYEARGDRSSHARCAAGIGTALIRTGKIREAVSFLEGATRGLDDLRPDAGMARLEAELARAYMLDQQNEASIRMADRAIAAAERLDLVDVEAEALVTKGTSISHTLAREGLAVLLGVQRLAQIRDLPGAEARAINNMSGPLSYEDPATHHALALRGEEIAARVGSRDGVQLFRKIRGAYRFTRGDLAGALALVGDYDADDVGILQRLELASTARQVLTCLGRLEERDRASAVWDELIVQVSNPEFHAVQHQDLGLIALFEGRPNDAVRSGREYLRAGIHPFEAWDIIGRGALRAGDATLAREALEGVQREPVRGRLADAQRRLLAAGVAALDARRDEAMRSYRDAERAFRDLGSVFELALRQLDLATALAGGPEAETLAKDALEIFERAGAAPLVVQARALLGDGAARDTRAPSTSAVDEGSRVG